LWWIQFSQLTELFAVGGSNTASVQNLDIVGNGCRDGLGNVAPDFGMGLLCLGGGGDLACADGPNGLVGNDDLAIKRVSKLRLLE